jgi:hypothetical protein
MTKDLAKARELAIKLGYLPRPSETVAQLVGRYEAHFRRKGDGPAEAKEKAEFWANLKATAPAGHQVIDPDKSVDDLLMEFRMERSGMDPRSITNDARQSIYAVEASTAGGPPSAIEQPPSYYFPISNGIQVDRSALNPGESFYRQLLKGSSFAGPAPQMFGSGPLPVITASGIDPVQLRWVPWFYRHTAALTESRALVVAIIEQGLTGAIDPLANQTAEGRELWQDYAGRIAQWVQDVPLDEQDGGIQAQIDRLYGPGTDGTSQ